MILRLLLLALLLCSSACQLDKDTGSVLGAITYRFEEGDTAILVANGYVALFTQADQETPVEVVQTDELGRFEFFAVEGSYVLSGASAPEGPFTLKTSGFAVLSGKTARLVFMIDEDPPVEG